MMKYLFAGYINICLVNLVLNDTSGVLGCQTQTALQVHNLAIPYVKGGIGMRICHGVKVLRSIYVSGSVGKVFMFLFPMSFFGLPKGVVDILSGMFVPK